MEINNFEDLMNFINNCNNPYSLVGKLHINCKTYLNYCDEQNIIDFITLINNKIPYEYIFPWFHTLVCEKFGFELVFPLTQSLDLKNRLYIFHVLNNSLKNR